MIRCRQLAYLGSEVVFILRLFVSLYHLARDCLIGLLLDQSSLSIADNSLNVLGVVEVSFLIDDSCSTHAQPGSRKVRPNALVTSLRPLWGYASRIYVMTLQDTPFLFIIKIYNAVPPQVVLLALDGLDCVFQVLVPQRTVFSASEQFMPEA